ncbi:MAG: homocysteine biosynthesis protein [Cyanobacteriota bacterium]|nr:homocysteine biosynthesis protein [Cyanobacteriota bacterium]
MPSRRAEPAPLAARRIEDLQRKQAAGDLQVRSAADYQSLVVQQGLAQAYQQTDVVVAADTVFSDQGSLLLSLGPSDPPIRLRELQLGGVAAQVSGGGGELVLPLGGALGDPSRRSGAQVLADLLSGQRLPLQGLGEGTVLQPRLELGGAAQLADFGVARLLLHKAISENGIVAASSGDGLLRTPFGPLLGPLVSALYTCAGPGSIGLTMPALSQLGPGSPVLVGGGLGWVLGAGSAHNPTVRRQASGHACAPGATAAVAVDLDQLDPALIRCGYLDGHGSAVLVAIAAPVLLLHGTIAAQAAATAEDLQAPVLDLAIPRRVKPQLGMVPYSQLRAGRLALAGQTLHCSPAHSPRLAAAACELLKDALQQGRFPLTAPLRPLPAQSGWNPFDP